MKRAIQAVSCVLALGILFSGCYYMSYRSALKKLQETEKQQQMNLLLDEENRQSERMFASLVGSEDDAMGPHSSLAELQVQTEQEDVQAVDKTVGEEPVVEANIVQESRIQPSTKILIESYEVTSKQFDVVEQRPDSVMVGMNRDELSAYLLSQLEGMSVSEFEKGFYANDLITFSEDKVIIRRSYDAERVNFRYYLAIKNGEVIVYYSDKKTVFEYTGIKAVELSEETRLQLLEGVQIETADELFSLLESFSS